MTTVRLRVDGELDMATAGRVEERVVTALTGDPRQDRVVLELGGLTFCDSSGLDALLAARAEADRRGVDLRVAGPQGIVRRSLEITGLLEVLGEETGQSR